MTPKYSGVGKVYRGDKEIATVRYLLMIVLGNQKDVRGQITVIQGEWSFISDNLLTLHLENGDWFEFTPMSQSGTPPQVTYRIFAAGRGLISNAAP